jgi:hypothetical protein
MKVQLLGRVKKMKMMELMTAFALAGLRVCECCVEFPPSSSPPPKVRAVDDGERLSIPATFLEFDRAGARVALPQFLASRLRPGRQASKVHLVRVFTNTASRWENKTIALRFRR